MIVGTVAGRRGLVWLAAAFVAVLSPVAAYLGSQIWLARSLTATIDTRAGLVLERIENSLERATTALREAHTRNLYSCGAPEKEALRLLVFESPILKELAVLGPDGRLLCNNIGSLVQISPGSTAYPTREPGLDLAVALTRGPYGRALRLQMTTPSGDRLGGLIAVGLFVPNSDILRSNLGVGIDIELVPGGRLVNIRGPGAVAGSADIRVVKLSERYPVKIEYYASEGAWMKERGWIVTASAGAGGGIGLLLALLMLVGGRERGPMADMHRALRNGEFIPHYQPIIDLDTGRILGCEVLVRWRKPDGRLIPPGAFIGEAERTGFIFPMTLAVMRQAAAELGPTYAARPELKCGFNLCAAHFRDQTIVSDVAAIFSRSDVALTQVLLEVTERDPLPDMDAARQIIARFQEMGVRVALDDVGTGHGGMSYLLKLRVDVMKIDKLFIDALGSERQSTAIVDSLIDLAAHLNMEVVAEGVETFDQVEALRRRGVRAAQGYVFAPPLPGSSFCQLVQAMEPVAMPQPPVRKALRG